MLFDLSIGAIECQYHVSRQQHLLYNSRNRSEGALRTAETLVESGYEAAQHLKKKTKT